MISEHGLVRQIKLKQSKQKTKGSFNLELVVEYRDEDKREGKQTPVSLTKL